MSVQRSQRASTEDSSSILDVEDMSSSGDMEDAYEGLVGSLVDVVVEGRKSDSFEELMDTLAVAGTYSSRNKFLIKVQNPNAIGPFNGYNQWINNFGRVPEEGSSALWILAPNIVEYCDKSDEKVNYCSDCEEDCKDTREVLVGFSSVPTFAYSQTVELPDEDKPNNIKDISVISEKEAQSDVNEEKLSVWYNNLISSYEEQGYDVEEVTEIDDWKISTGARGFFEHSDGSVTVRNFRVGDESQNVQIAERLSTLIHEVAHSYLSHDEENISDGKKEMEAEAVAYVVCNRLNIETDAGVYISNHLNSEIKDLTDREQVRGVVRESIERIGDVSGRILESIRTPQ